jgi:hypothetical protein
VIRLNSSPDAAFAQGMEREVCSRARLRETLLALAQVVGDTAPGGGVEPGGRAGQLFQLPSRTGSFDEQPKAFLGAGTVRGAVLLAPVEPAADRSEIGGMASSVAVDGAHVY